MTTVIPKEEAQTIMDRIETFLSSSAFTTLFKSLGLGVTDVSLTKMMVQSSSEPYTCYDGTISGEETDVDFILDILPWLILVALVLIFIYPLNKSRVEANTAELASRRDP